MAQVNLHALEKATKEELIEAFDGKYITVGDHNSALVCFKVDGNQVKAINHPSKCAEVVSVYISAKGRICAEFTDKERCGKVRILSNGDFAFGSKLRPVTISESKRQMLGKSDDADKKNVSRLAKKYYKKATKLYKKKQYWEAVETVKKAAELGYAKAQRRYAHALEKGKGADKDLEQAKIWYEKAALQNDVEAQFRLGNIYRLDGDYEPALKWTKKAANSGHVGAQNNVGYMYKKGMATGWGDSDEALKWYTMAAEGGNKVGQYNVCLILYRKGAHKYTEAKKWCERSAGQGYRHASDLLERMENW